jgi:hypothetical protein
VRDDAVAVWLLAVGVLALGGFAVHARYEPAIRSVRERMATLYARTAADEGLVRDASSLRVLERRCARDLEHVSRERSVTAATAALLRSLDRRAATFGTQVEEVTPVSAAAAAHAPGAQLLDSTEVTVRARGRFRNLVRFLSALSRGSTLVAVSGMDVALADATRVDRPELEATIHAVLYRIHAGH